MKRDQTRQELSSEDCEALERSAEDGRLGRFATDEEVKRIFGHLSGIKAGHD